MPSITSSSNVYVTNPEEIFELLSVLDIKKAVGFEMIPTKLVKMAASVLCQPLSNAINNSLSKGIFPDDAKIAMVSPFEKGTSSKNDISNFRPVSILTTFSKIHERVTKKMIDKAMDKYLSETFISAYRQNYNTQHVLIRLPEEWKEGLDNNFVVRGVFMDLSKSFDCIPHDLLITKLKAFDDYLVNYFYSYIDNRKQCVRINNEKVAYKI